MKIAEARAYMKYLEPDYVDKSMTWESKPDDAAEFERFKTEVQDQYPGREFQFNFRIKDLGL